MLAEMREFAAKQDRQTLESGAWFQQIIKAALGTYSKNANAAFFKSKYPGLPPDAVSEILITTAKRYAMLEGGVSAAAYSAAIASTIGSGGGASPLTIPAALGAFAVDLSFTTALQLRLAHDLAVIYGVPVDLDDPEDVWELVLVAFGVKAGEVGREAVAKAAPEAVRQGVKAVVRGPVLEFLKRLPFIGQYILQRRLIQFAIPLVGIPLNAGMNWWTTSSISKRARTVYRDKASIHEAAEKIMADEDVDPMLVLRTMWWIAQADGKVTDGEARLLRMTIEMVKAAGADGAALEAFESTINIDVAELLSKISALADLDAKKAIYEGACRTAGVDREFAVKEVDALRQLAGACGVDFDEKALKEFALR
jgi:uncharacterized protein (DUF697 family)